MRAGRRHAAGCCSRAASRWRPVTWSMGRRRCWSTRVGNGVHGFTLDPSIGAYMLTHENIRMPRQGKYYSVNEANRDSFPPAYNAFLDWAAPRRAGRALQLALHRLDGRRRPSHAAQAAASFCIRPRPNTPAANCGCCTKPTRSLFSSSRPAASPSTAGRRILDIQPESIHQRTPLVVGSPVEMEHLAQCQRRFDQPAPAAPAR